MTSSLLAIISLLLFSGEVVRCWSISSFFSSGEGDSDAVTGGNTRPPPTKKHSTQRTLSSFGEQNTHTIPRSQLVANHGRRDVEALVKAHSWPTTIFSPICEAWAYFDAGSSIGKLKSSQFPKGQEEESTHSSISAVSSAWNYLDVMVERGGITSLDNWVDGSKSIGNDQLWTYKNSTKLALDVASQAMRFSKSSSSYQQESKFDERLLPLALSFRTHALHCEMHRSLARDAAVAFGLYDGEIPGKLGGHQLSATSSLPAAFCVVSRIPKEQSEVFNVKVFDAQVIADAGLLLGALDELHTIGDEKEFLKGKWDNDSSRLLMPLPDEMFHPEALSREETSRKNSDTSGKTKNNDREIVAILYGQVGTSAFASFYQALKRLEIKFVVRHMGYIPFEEEKIMSEQFPLINDVLPHAIPTELQGYGVRLDIRNVEYKAFDDGLGDKLKEKGETEINWNNAGHSPIDPARNEYLAGINLHAILSRLNVTDAASLDPDLLALQTALLQSHLAQSSSQSFVPPAWQRRSLSLQAATVIASSTDPLETLKGVSQYLPSVAHSLSHVHVAEDFKQLAEEATTLAKNIGATSSAWGDAAFGLYVNTRKVDVERSSFNVFQLLDVLREEDFKLRDLEMKIRPTLERTAMLLGRKGNGVEVDELSSLHAVRDVMDVGPIELTSMGKKGLFGNEAFNEKELGEEEAIDDAKNNEDLDVSPSRKHRIDVGRGGKNAVLYLNDIERDREYKSWPNSLQQMFYSAQFGGAPSVRRNLFTMLVVVDPTSKTSNPAFDVIGQLINSQFPMRLGLLLVDGKDVANGVASQPTSWDSGNRPFHASDAPLMLWHIYKNYGGMVSISCFLQSMDYIRRLDGLPTVRDYIEIFVSLLDEMGALQTKSENEVLSELQQLLQSGSSVGKVGSEDLKDNKVKYDLSVQYALNKMIRPGMTFLNGLPLPDGSDLSNFGSGVNQILQSEQRHIMELAMSGVLTDTSPRSIYAHLLTGSNVFKRFHPLLQQPKGEYSLISLHSDEASLLFPNNTSFEQNEIDAIFVVEGVFDFETSEGIDAAISFLECIRSPPKNWHQSKNVSVAFRVIPHEKAGSYRSKALSNIFCVASRFDTTDLIKVIDALRRSSNGVDEVLYIIEHISGMGEGTKQEILNFAKKSECPYPRPPSFKNHTHFFLGNGRRYASPENAPISVEDIKMLVHLELDKTIAMTKLITPHLLPRKFEKLDGKNSSSQRLIHNAVGTSASVLNKHFSSLSSSSNNLAAGIPKNFSSLRNTKVRNPLNFSWNDDASTAHLQIKISIILDPLTEPTQRVAPLLIVIRDLLKLPLKLIIAPRQIVENQLPLSSYYRFVSDPLASPEENIPKALFLNLPPNHLLTLRMDVPEQWDVQQAYAVQDADNIRCDVRYGCGDNVYMISKQEMNMENTQKDATLVKLTQVEYELKSLLFFGQCYDVSRNTPPNGLQLTLDKSKISGSKRTAKDALVNLDGSIAFEESENRNQNNLIREHTDTLVMKTVGYWQLRGNPGVWNLRIAENSKGAEIYYMVDDPISHPRMLLTQKNSTDSNSKLLVMKDFSNLGRFLLVKRRKGFEKADLFEDEDKYTLTRKVSNDTVHIFSLATGHAYERLLKIMMLSVTKRTTSPVKFWLFENFLSPSFKTSAVYMAERIGCELEFVTYKWPEWLRGQSEKQRIIWGYKILFLDVLFPLDVKKIIYVDADQVVRGDMTELWNLDLEGAPYGYTPFCDSREETLGYQFWRTGFWKSHLREKPYHISALYVVDLERFRRELVGDKLRAIYQQLSADPNSLANLDQDLPNYAQHDVRIFSLPQKWLWCESWCSDETKAQAMTIDLCNNPLHKEAKISMAKRVISGSLFEESWEELDNEVEQYEDDFLVYRKNDIKK